ncbi:hypothetical protein M3Y99_01349200 [Aphelenchoides fujianensis]|nr:hypothetical protein M3Y99_01349200 [Aphelenchoides fujianensis]
MNFGHSPPSWRAKRDDPIGPISGAFAALRPRPSPPLPPLLPPSLPTADELLDENADLRTQLDVLIDRSEAAEQHCRQLVEEKHSALTNLERQVHERTAEWQQTFAALEAAKLRAEEERDRWQHAYEALRRHSSNGSAPEADTTTVASAGGSAGCLECVKLRDLITENEQKAGELRRHYWALQQKFFAQRKETEQLRAHNRELANGAHKDESAVKQCVQEAVEEALQDLKKRLAKRTNELDREQRRADHYRRDAARYCDERNALRRELRVLRPSAGGSPDHSRLMSRARSVGFAPHRPRRHSRSSSDSDD